MLISCCFSLRPFAEEFALEGIFGKGPEIGSLASARQLARKLFSHLESDRTEGDRPDGERVIVVDDFVPVRLSCSPFFFPSLSCDQTSSSARPSVKLISV
jgi:hypothetical protein